MLLLNPLKFLMEKTYVKSLITLLRTIYSLTMSIYLMNLLIQLEIQTSLSWVVLMGMDTS